METWQYIRALVAEIGLSQRAIARQLGLNEATFRRYLMPADKKSAAPAPYVVQFALEAWASGTPPEGAAVSLIRDKLGTNGK